MQIFCSGLEHQINESISILFLPCARRWIRTSMLCVCYMDNTTQVSQVNGAEELQKWRIIFLELKTSKTKLGGWLSIDWINQSNSQSKCFDCVALSRKESRKVKTRKWKLRLRFVTVRRSEWMHSVLCAICKQQAVCILIFTLHRVLVIFAEAGGVEEHGACR